MMKDEQIKAVNKLCWCFVECLKTVCEERCPENKGMEDKCRHCEVQRLFELSQQLKVQSQINGETSILHGLKWLLEKEHPAI